MRPVIIAYSREQGANWEAPYVLIAAIGAITMALHRRRNNPQMSRTVVGRVPPIGCTAKFLELSNASTVDVWSLLVLSTIFAIHHEKKDFKLLPWRSFLGLNVGALEWYITESYDFDHDSSGSIPQQVVENKTVTN